MINTPQDEPFAHDEWLESGASVAVYDETDSEDDSEQASLRVDIVPDECYDQRLDQVLALLHPDYSRSQLQKWLKAGKVLVNGKQLKAKEKLAGGETIELHIEQEVRTAYEAEPISLDIVFEDDELLVLNKPVNLVVHPAAGNWSGTLVNGLLHYLPALEQLPRAGIVHRLDKDTSGLMVVAKTLSAHAALVEQLQQRTVSREYLALVHRPIVAGGSIEGNIGRHHIDRKKMTVTDAGKYALTHYRIEERFQHHTLLRVSLETGRTHQIRVHLAWRQMPIVGDHVYGGRPRVPAKISVELRDALLTYPHQALHATRLGLLHPATGEAVAWEAPAPSVMQDLLQKLRDEDEQATL